MVKNNFKLGELTGELSGIKRELREIKDFVKNYGSRLEELENWRSQIAGVVIGVSIVISTAITVVLFFIQKLFNALK